MEIFGQTSIQSILFFALYGVTGAMPLVAALYLLLRPCNVFSASITPPVRLRRWAAAFFALLGTGACVVAAVLHLLSRFRFRSL